MLSLSRNLRSLSRPTQHILRASFNSVNVLDGELPKNDEYKLNQDTLAAIVGNFKTNLGKVLEGGGEKLKAKHKARGKLLARERIDQLVDVGSPFLEFSAMAGHHMPYGNVPSGGVVTGIGRVNGINCVIVANDATVKGGTYVRWCDCLLWF
jgi:3-methylcrotonyl-CoA carboxylase beta subunit